MNINELDLSNYSLSHDYSTIELNGLTKTLFTCQIGNGYKIITIHQVREAYRDYNYLQYILKVDGFVKFDRAISYIGPFYREVPSKTFEKLESLFKSVANESIKRNPPIINDNSTMELDNLLESLGILKKENKENK